MSRRPSIPSTLDSASVSSAEADDEKYKYILILGPGFDPRTMNMRKFINQYFDKTDDHKLVPKPGFLVIGDGEREVSLDEIKALKGKIETGTRIDVIGHGESLRKSGIRNRLFRKNKSKYHNILLSRDKTKFQDLAEALKEASEDKPVETHLWSCYGGLAVRDVDALPKGSVMVAHGSEKQRIYYDLVIGGFTRSLQGSISSAKESTRAIDYLSIAKNLVNGSNQKFVASISGAGKSVKFRVPIEDMLDKDKFAAALMESQKEFLKLNGIDDTSSISRPNDKDLKLLMANYLVNRYIKKPGKLKEFLKTDKGKEGLIALKSEIENPDLALMEIVIRGSDLEMKNYLINEIGLKDKPLKEYYKYGNEKILESKLASIPEEKIAREISSASLDIGALTPKKFDTLKKFLNSHGIEDSNFFETEGMPTDIISRAHYEGNVNLVKHLADNIKNGKISLSDHQIRGLKEEISEYDEPSIITMKEIMNKAVDDKFSPPTKKVTKARFNLLRSCLRPDVSQVSSPHTPTTTTTKKSKDSTRSK